MLEYEAVMTRAEHLKVSGLSHDDIDVLLDAVAAVAEPVHIDFHWHSLARDPDDDMVAETAMNGRADAIVTLNIADFDEIAVRSDLRIWRPAEAVRRLEMGP